MSCRKTSFSWHYIKLFTDSTSNREIEIDNYNLIKRESKNKSGGVVALYIRNDLEHIELDIKDKYEECL